MGQDIIHRYIPNSAPSTKQYMLDTLGVKSVDEYYEELPENVRFKGTLDIRREPMTELETANYVKRVLAKNVSSENLISFLGAGCCNHYVPAICDEINGRAEFVTAYSGNMYCDRGRMQAKFEACSMVGDLLEMDVVATAVYDTCTACGDAIQMARRYSNRTEVLAPENMNPESIATMRTYGSECITVATVSTDPETGMMNLDDLRAKIGANTAAVLVENPSYLGFFETQLDLIGKLAHRVGALFIVVCEPFSLSIVQPPASFGADIAIMTGQPLGLHMNFGGGQCAYIACRNEEKLVNLIPTFFYSACDTVVPGEIAFDSHGLYKRTFFEIRDEAESFTGTATGLWVITNGVYLSLMGSAGMDRIAKVIMSGAEYLKGLLNKIPGVNANRFKAQTFKEFVVDFNTTGKTVRQINDALLKRGILGGKDLSRDYPHLGQCALYCVTEVLSKEDLDALAVALTDTLEEVLL
ncbi:MAG: aminomethyl-transferring glycine dehydrogenase subunit GcvPA [Oscillospiraceae bacterium]|nr:aminomethyl-transferring glycine dehydrogenase subunit GcvPA [Oscillospiraceae bacterium]